LKFPNNKKICDDIFKCINKNKNWYITNGLKQKNQISNNHYYTNFITFLKNCFEYDQFQNKNINIVDFIDDFSNLELFFKIMNKYNVFVVEQSSFVVYYLSDSKLSSITKLTYETDIYNFLDNVNKNKIIILYMVRNNGKGLVRFVELDNNPKYIQFNVKERKRKERKEKLDIIEQINEV